MNNEYSTDLIGKQFGFLEVVKKDSEKTKQGKAKWICKCHACGKTKSIPRAALISGNARSCGCRVRAAKGKNVMDLNGKTFGFLEVLRKISGCGGETVWECKCLRCGATKNILQRSLVNGATKSCGCLHRELSSQNVKKYIENIDKTTVSVIRSKKKYASNTSGVRGVSWSKNTQKWHAYIQFRGTLYNLGYYADINEAASVRKTAEEKMFGEFLEWYEKQKSEGDKMERAEEVAERLRNSGEWLLDECIELCRLADMEEEFRQADEEGYDSFESVLFRAAEKLGVDIW